MTLFRDHLPWLPLAWPNRTEELQLVPYGCDRFTGASPPAPLLHRRRCHCARRATSCISGTRARPTRHFQTAPGISGSGEASHAAAARFRPSCIDRRTDDNRSWTYDPIFPRCPLKLSPMIVDDGASGNIESRGRVVAVMYALLYTCQCPLMAISGRSAAW